MMEAIERYSGERCDLRIFLASTEEVFARGASIDPAELIVPTVRSFPSDEQLEWVEGYDLLGEEPCLAPLNAVVCPYEGRPSCPPIWYASTNGLASGNSLEEAVCHALCEVFERDALALSSTVLDLKPAVDCLILELGHQTEVRRQQGYSLIDHDSLPHRERLLVERFRAAGLLIYLRDLSASVGFPTFDCTVVEPQLGGYVVHGGCGTHPDARVAVSRALTEAAQSRVACIQGGREDLPEIIAPPRNFDPDAFYGQGEVQMFADVQSFQHDTVDEDIRFLLSRARARGFERVVAFDLTRPELGVPAVRIIMPKAEAWTVFHLHTGRGVFGGRVSQLVRQLC
jgi:ribosomal protein S12 methylthiotransferase accessory factor